MDDDGLIPADAFAAPPSAEVDVSGIDPAGRPIGPQRKSDAKKALLELSLRLKELQTRLLAQGAAGNPQRLLLILQGMDTCGKDGVIKHVLGGLNPVGVRVASFEKPTRRELAHHFLWRIKRQVPGAGVIGAFNRSHYEDILVPRSHYEDILVPRVHETVPATVLAQRYAEINGFEQHLANRGVLLVKCFLHISPGVQEKRLIARLDDPKKTWKYDPDDVIERARWDSYQRAYNDAITTCAGPDAPWSIIPSDHKWYRNWAVAALLARRLRDLDPQFPEPPDAAHERARVMATRVEIRGQHD